MQTADSIPPHLDGNDKAALPLSSEVDISKFPASQTPAYLKVLKRPLLPDQP